MWRQPPRGPGRPRYWGFTITLRHTTLGVTPLDGWSARRRDLYLKTHNIQNRHISMSQAGSEPAIPPPGLVSKTYVKQKNKNYSKLHTCSFSRACILLPVLWSSSFIYSHSHFHFQLALLPLNVPMPTGEMGVTNIAEVFRDIPKADSWIHMYLCLNSGSDNIIMYFFKK
jgi:hypothetical protein